MARRRDLLTAASTFAARLALGPAAGAASLASATTSLPLGPFGVVGTRYHAASRVASSLTAGDALCLQRDPSNRHDSWAVAIETLSGDRLGYLPRGENRQIAGLLDAGAHIRAEMLEGHPFESPPNNWRIAVRLTLDGIAAPPAVSEVERDGLADLLRATPLMAERQTGPDYGGRAVMLAGPCAGWQRTKAAEWVPPGSLPWPAADVIAADYKFTAGEIARAETARALREAAARGLAVSGVPPRPERPAMAVDRPPERPRLLLRGAFDTRAHGDGLPEGSFRPLDDLKLRRTDAPPGRTPRIEVLDRDDRILARLRPDVGAIVGRLLDEGYLLDIVSRPPGPRPRTGGGLRVPFELRLRGDDPPDVARRRADYLRLIADFLPPGWDAERHFGQLPEAVLFRFLTEAAPLADCDGGRLDEAAATRLAAELRIQGNRRS